MYDYTVINEVKEKCDIVDIISQYIPLTKKQRTHFGVCPHCHTNTLVVSRENQTYHCFGCGNEGTVFTFIMDYCNLSFAQAIEKLAEIKGIQLPERISVMDPAPLLLQLNQLAMEFYRQQLYQTVGANGLSYFKQTRTLTDDTIARFGLGYASGNDSLYNYLISLGYTNDHLRDSGLVDVDERVGRHDKFYNRVMFPIFNAQNQVIGFGGRIMGDGKPKYLNTRETVVFDKRNNLYGFNYAVNSQRDGFVLCEGYMDVIAMHQAGFDNAIASLGTAYTLDQAKLIKQYRDIVYLAYDSDGPGQQACRKAIEICRKAGLITRVIDLNPYKDPDEFIKALGKQAYEQRIMTAAGGIMFAINTTVGTQYNVIGKQGFETSVAKMLLG